MKNVAIVGGTGYGAVELIRLLQLHKEMQVTKIISQSQAKEQLAMVYPHLASIITNKLEVLDIEALEREIDILFLAAPAGVAKDILPSFQKTSVQCVDLSGDFRLSAQEYIEWYGKEPAAQELLEEAVFGLSEVFTEKIKRAKIISNPGCFPTAALLPLIPLVKADIIETSGIRIDGKTGISGAGRGLSEKTHFSATNENIKPYKIGEHQHIPEIERYASLFAEDPFNVTFTTHLIPMTRGLMCTIYAPLKKRENTVSVLGYLQEYYQDKPFVRILPEGNFPTTKGVAGSNYCDIGAYVDERTKSIVITGVIDNLVKGAAGQAIQNVNIMNGWDETAGLEFIPVYP
ncbi:N-acetyl-gamma-glutamyl-phosphate reductase [Oceanobacillus sp. J11TS1]|uniref:N-acetyl-gamma-glutamyl-phosphate reductase n=1 Tax=Oceanobacillus sp. J11TS1 TaxID=2807191 RepID=UPI001B28E0D4|nr:N-acetyl-gamma-glutamyl-phosphate reductase [Oceanobacillus sp. J11TS1]GIO21573.1 N-acetyl-gamma-glutamyl-phosphate reductase [Oceanobacillus sp. J11TS1]